ncbi:hypothetical protein D3C80_997820 [compost metagenome]
MRNITRSNTSLIALTMADAGLVSDSSQTMPSLIAVTISQLRMAAITVSLRLES